MAVVEAKAATERQASEAALAALANEKAELEQQISRVADGLMLPQHAPARDRGGSAGTGDELADMEPAGAPAVTVAFPGKGSDKAFFAGLAEGKPASRPRASSAAASPADFFAALDPKGLKGDSLRPRAGTSTPPLPNKRGAPGAAAGAAAVAELGARAQREALRRVRAEAAAWRRRAARRMALEPLPPLQTHDGTHGDAPEVAALLALERQLLASQADARVVVLGASGHSKPNAVDLTGSLTGPFTSGNPPSSKSGGLVRAQVLGMRLDAARLAAEHRAVCTRALESLRDPRFGEFLSAAGQQTVVPPAAAESPVLVARVRLPAPAVLSGDGSVPVAVTRNDLARIAAAVF